MPVFCVPAAVLHDVELIIHSASSSSTSRIHSKKLSYYNY